jgi:hypothetical protein
VQKTDDANNALVIALLKGGASAYVAVDPDGSDLKLQQDIMRALGLIRRPGSEHALLAGLILRSWRARKVPLPTDIKRLFTANLDLTTAPARAIQQSFLNYDYFWLNAIAMNIWAIGRIAWRGAVTVLNYFWQVCARVPSQPEASGLRAPARRPVREGREEELRPSTGQVEGDAPVLRAPTIVQRMPAVIAAAKATPLARRRAQPQREQAAVVRRAAKGRLKKRVTQPEKTSQITSIRAFVAVSAPAPAAGAAAPALAATPAPVAAPTVLPLSECRFLTGCGAHSAGSGSDSERAPSVASSESAGERVSGTSCAILSPLNPDASSFSPLPTAATAPAAAPVLAAISAPVKSILTKKDCWQDLALEINKIHRTLQNAELSDALHLDLRHLKDAMENLIAKMPKNVVLNDDASTSCYVDDDNVLFLDTPSLLRHKWAVAVIEFISNAKKISYTLSKSLKALLSKSLVVGKEELHRAYIAPVDSLLFDDAPDRPLGIMNNLIHQRVLPGRTRCSLYGSDIPLLLLVLLNPGLNLIGVWRHDIDIKIEVPQGSLVKRRINNIKRHLAGFIAANCDASRPPVSVDGVFLALKTTFFDGVPCDLNFVPKACVSDAFTTLAAGSCDLETGCMRLDIDMLQALHKLPLRAGVQGSGYRLNAQLLSACHDRVIPFKSLMMMFNAIAKVSDLLNQTLYHPEMILLAPSMMLALARHKGFLAAMRKQVYGPPAATAGVKRLTQKRWALSLLYNIASASSTVATGNPQEHGVVRASGAAR